MDFFFMLIFGQLSPMSMTEKTEIQKKFQTQSKNIKQFVKNIAHFLKCIYWNRKNGFFYLFMKDSWKSLWQFEAKVYSSFKQVAHVY